MIRRRRLQTQLAMVYAVPFSLISGIALILSMLQGRKSVPVGLRPDAPATPDERANRILIFAVLGLLFLVGVSVILGFLVADRYLAPLRKIISKAQDISASNLHRRLGDSGHDDEFNDLAKTLDDVFERLERAFEEQRRFVANASHELRTPLAAERALLQVALTDPEADVGALRVVCGEVLELGAAQERLIDALLTLARGEQLIELSEPVDLSELAARAIAAHSPPPAPESLDPAGAGPTAIGAADAKPGITNSTKTDPSQAHPAENGPFGDSAVTDSAVTDSPVTDSPVQSGLDDVAPDDIGPDHITRGGIRIWTDLTPALGTGDPRLIASLVANLVDNAVRHNKPGGSVEIITGVVEGRAGITVRNTGPIVPAAELERLFLPFQRLTGQRTSYDGGHGLGLAIVRSIAKAHAAAVRTRPRDTGGLEVQVHLQPLPTRRPGQPESPGDEPDDW